MIVSQTELNALQSAKAFWGRHWKQKLSFAWETGRYPATLKQYEPAL